MKKCDVEKFFAVDEQMNGFEPKILFVLLGILLTIPSLLISF